jgi:hypothetical protein
MLEITSKHWEGMEIEWKAHGNCMEIVDGFSMT